MTGQAVTGLVVVPLRPGLLVAAEQPVPGSPSGRARWVTGRKGTSAMQPARDAEQLDDDVDPIAEGLSAIIKGLKPGDRLPPERELATRLGVSRTALRDRLQQAEALGVLRRRVGSGTYVERIDPNGLATGLQLAIDASQIDLSSLHSVRVALERQAALDAARHRPEIPLAEMAEAIALMRSAAADRDMARMAEADAYFHRALMDSSANTALAFFGHAMAKVRRDAMRTRTRQLSLVDRTPTFIVELHSAIFSAISSGDPERATEAVESHFAEFAQAVVEIGQHPYAE
ncbi:FadR/GntR family transcriptional regulator [Pseudonocardia sp. Ae717_Ps2]|uniref:FadR/GntR family transcriptional regulator n=1 Tax=Pseudonocardia sp. Ae717_Ps2 TaxID=1885573 RepID=UPI0009F9490C|nr:FCD domain-containing protein [Pseudonocardia sp. Ae717_Ps2]